MNKQTRKRKACVGGCGYIGRCACGTGFEGYWEWEGHRCRWKVGGV